MQGEVNDEFLEKVLREQILGDVTRFFNLVHKPIKTSPFIPEETQINYSGRVYDEKEIVNLVDTALEFYLTAGRYDTQFCKGLSEFLESASAKNLHSLTVNSGSSANLIAMSSLTSPKLGDLSLSEGDEVITVAAGFPTTIAPIMQNKLIPVFVDIQQDTLNIDYDQIESVITDRTRAIMSAHTLGIPMNMEKILEIAEKHKLWVVEDNCDALGATYELPREFRLIKGKNVSGKAFTGTVGHIGTSSFYPAHQITMGEGGAVYTTDADLYKIALSFRDWGRDCWCDAGKDNTCRKRFEWQLGLLPEGYDHKYIYSHIGYNLKVTDMQAAIGVAQLEKLASFAKTRFDNWKQLRNGLSNLEDKFIIHNCSENSTPSPFGFALTVKDDAGFSRKEITSYLENNKIQTRTVFAGNILRQPALKEADVSLRIRESPLLQSKDITNKYLKRLPNTERVMNDTFWVGVFPGLKKGMIEHIIEKIRSFVKK
ncbi:MAG: lipopolysaccharide biosynthesis protein RfbH [Nitrospina sp.]|nr:lipopolysaccharide biosynthesis protein RfbH [Nitrospina sp.]